MIFIRNVKHLDGRQKKIVKNRVFKPPEVAGIFKLSKVVGIFKSPEIAGVFKPSEIAEVFKLLGKTEVLNRQK